MNRFGAQSYFEFRALEAPWAVDLLCSIRLAGPAATNGMQRSALHAAADAERWADMDSREEAR
jgi:hypothetical protein